MGFPYRKYPIRSGYAPKHAASLAKSEPHAPGSGGFPGTGGVTNTGGVASSGGVTSSGGTISSGGVTATGGLTNSGGVTSSGGVTATGGAPTGHFQMENLDRGVVAVVVAGGVYVGWHMFGYEYDATVSSVSYNLYRDGTKIATVTDSANFLDAAGIATSKYAVTAVIRGTEGPQSPAITPWAQNYLSMQRQEQLAFVLQHRSRRLGAAVVEPVDQSQTPAWPGQRPAQRRCHAAEPA